MVELKAKTNGSGVVGEDIWVSGMRQAGFSDQEINRVVTVATALAESGNGHRELVPVKEAARRLGRSENTVRSWIRLGHLRPVDIPPPPDHAKGPWYHVEMADVEELDRRSRPELDEGNLITLREAAEQFGLKLSRIQGWVHRGVLKVRNERTKTGPTGGILLVSLNDVEGLMANPPKPTGRPKKQRS